MLIIKILFFVLTTFMAGRAIAKSSLNDQTPFFIQELTYLIIGFLSVAMLGAGLLFTNHFDWAQYLTIAVFAVAVILNLDIILNLTKTLKYIKTNYLSFIFLFTFWGLLIFATQLQEFRLLWDAQSSWFMKSKSFFYESTFPNLLFNTKTNIIVVKDYPLWNSVYYGMLDRFIGVYSDMANKLVQSLFPTLLITAFIQVVYNLITAKQILIKLTPAWLLTTFAVLIVFSNFFFLQWLGSGYVDITLSAFLFLISYFLIRFVNTSNQQNKMQYAGMAFVVASGSVLIKNEGISFAIATVMTLIAGMLGDTAKTRFSDLWLNLVRFMKQLGNGSVFVLASILSYVSWYFIKIKYGYSSDLVGGVAGGFKTFAKHFVEFFYLLSRQLLLFDGNRWGPNLIILFIGLAFIIYIFVTTSRGLKLLESIRRNPLIIFVFTLYFFYILAYIITPETRFQFFFAVTFDRLVTQTAPMIALLSIFVYSTLVKPISSPSQHQK